LRHSLFFGLASRISRSQKCTVKEKAKDGRPADQTPGFSIRVSLVLFPGLCTEGTCFPGRGPTESPGLPRSPASRASDFFCCVIALPPRHTASLLSPLLAAPLCWALE
jgi:hypothetical protein